MLKWLHITNVTRKRWDKRVGLKFCLRGNSANGQIYEIELKAFFHTPGSWLFKSERDRTCDCQRCSDWSWSCNNIPETWNFWASWKGKPCDQNSLLWPILAEQKHFILVHKAEITHPFCTCELLLLWCCSLHTGLPFFVIHIGLSLATDLCNRLLLLCYSMFGNVVSCGVLHRSCVTLYLQHLIPLTEHRLCGNTHEWTCLPEVESRFSSVITRHLTGKNFFEHSCVSKCKS